MKSTISQEQISQTAVKLGIPNVAFTQRRIARAFDLVATNKVNEVSREDGFYRVHSQYNDKIYTIELNPRVRSHARGNPAVTRLAKGKACAPHCTCPDGERTIFCKHSIASMMTMLENEPRMRFKQTGGTNRKPSPKKAPKLIVKETVHNDKVKASWVVIEDGRTYVTVWQDLNGKICCVCGAYYKRDCIHKQAIRDWEGSNYLELEGAIENECGTSEAKSLQDKLNGNNGTGDIKSPSHNLDVSNPFQECEMLDLDQIEGRSNGDLAHKLSNGEYVVSYRGIMALATKNNIDFPSVIKDNKAVIAYAKKDGQSRLSGKPVKFYNNEMNAEVESHGLPKAKPVRSIDISSITPRANAVDTAIELAKRNAARQLLPLPEIKALEHKAKLERGAIATKRCNAFRAEFNWQVAKRKCLEIVPDFTFDILINDLIKAGTLRQAHSSDYSRKEWLVIFDACKRDAETNGNDDDDGAARKVSAKADDTANTASSNEQVLCAICSRTLTNPESVRLQVGPICREKIGIEGEAHLHGNIISDELIEASKLYQDEALRKRIIKACLTLDAWRVRSHALGTCQSVELVGKRIFRLSHAEGVALYCAQSHREPHPLLLLRRGAVEPY